MSRSGVTVYTCDHCKRYVPAGSDELTTATTTWVTIKLGKPLEQIANRDVIDFCSWDHFREWVTAR